jgi:hypothetical protein
VEFIFEVRVSNEKLSQKLVNIIMSLLFIAFAAFRLLGGKADIMNKLLLHLVLDVFPRKVW